MHKKPLEFLLQRRGALNVCNQDKDICAFVENQDHSGAAPKPRMGQAQDCVHRGTKRKRRRVPHFVVEKQMVDVTLFYNYRQVGTAQSTRLFTRDTNDRRPLLQDLPIQVEQLPRLISFVLDMKHDNPGADMEDFLPGGVYYQTLQDEIVKCNQAGYAYVETSGKEPDIQDGYIQMAIFRGFAKPASEVNAILEQQRKDRERAEREGGQAAAGPVVGPVLPRTVVTDKQAIRKRTPPQKNLLPMLRPNAPPMRERSRTRSPPPRSRSRSPSRTPPPPPPFDFPAPFGGGDSRSAVSVGQESSLTRLLNRIGTYESMSELWTVDTNNLRSLFPEALRMREPQVVVAEMEFEGAGIEPDVLIEDK